MIDARVSPLLRVAPWAMWGGVAAIVVVLWHDVGGRNAATALVDVREANIPAPQAAVIERVLVTGGDVVHAGDVLVQLDPRQADDALAVAQAELERVRSTVKAREVGVADQDFEVGMRLSVEHERATVALATLRSELGRDEGELHSLDEQIARQDALVAQKLASSSTRDELALRRAAVSERVAQAAQERLAAEQYASSAGKRLTEWRGRHGDAALLTAPDRAAVVAQEERVKQATQARERLRLRAPADGRVAALFVSAGDVVQEGQPLVSIVRDDTTTATAWVLEDSAWRVQPGDRATLRTTVGRDVQRQGTVRALGGAILEMPARLRVIPNEPVFGRAVFIDVEPSSSPDDALLPGQSLEVSFARGGGAR